MGLHIASNIIGAYPIRSTKGYETINVWPLVLLWCTRPRVAWLIVMLIPWQAQAFVYFSVAASTLLAEVMLQVLGSVYMGIASNYARRQHFYLAGSLSQIPHGKDALIMYSGSLMWLIVILFAVATCACSILGVDRHVAGLGQLIRGVSRKAKRSGKIACSRGNQLYAIAQENDR